MPNLRALNQRIVYLLRQAQISNLKTEDTDDLPMADEKTRGEDSEATTGVSSEEVVKLTSPSKNVDASECTKQGEAVINASSTLLPIFSPRKRQGKLCNCATGNSLQPIQRLPYVRGFPKASQKRPEPIPKESTLNEEWKSRQSTSQLANGVKTEREIGLSSEVDARMFATRQAFVNRARHYMGCLYRKGAQIRPGQFIGNGTEDPDLFLDCCGLVRRCVQDLKSEFGFELGPWNQGYLFDTLPVKVSVQDLLPGDLIFVQGRYRDSKKKQPPHDIVHVEIFIGGRSGLRRHSSLHFMLLFAE